MNIEDFPEVIPRQPFDEDNPDPDGYLESDNDFVENNLAAAVWFLENSEEIFSFLKRVLP